MHSYKRTQAKQLQCPTPNRGGRKKRKNKKNGYMATRFSTKLSSVNPTAIPALQGFLKLLPQLLKNRESSLGKHLK